MTKAEFQQAHGAMWEQMIRQPAFFAAMQLCSSERLREIEQLTAQEIEANARVHLANFQGHLKTESILLSLAVESTLDTNDLPPSDYGAPVSLESIFFQEPPPPQTKPKRRKSK